METKKRKTMKKSKLNFIIDGILFLLMGLLTGIGLLIKYVLLSGEDRWIKYGKNVNITFLNMDRHQWGYIHLIVGIVLIVFLVLHIIFHWNMIVCLCKSLISQTIVRVSVVVVFLLLTTVFTVFPFFIKTNVSDLAAGKERFKESAEVNKVVVEKENTEENKLTDVVVEERHKDEHHNIDPSIEVKGYMTLQEVSDKYNVPCDIIKEKLDIPTTISNSSQLGHLRKQYGFKMSEIELIIAGRKDK